MRADVCVQVNDECVCVCVCVCVLVRVRMNVLCMWVGGECVCTLACQINAPPFRKNNKCSPSISRLGACIFSSKFPTPCLF